MSDKFRKAFRRLLSCGKLSEPPHNHLYCYNNQDHRHLNSTSRASPSSLGGTTRNSILGPVASSSSAAAADPSSLLRTKSTTQARNRSYAPRLSEPAIMPRVGSNLSLNHLSPGWQATPSSNISNSSSCHSNVARVSVATQVGCGGNRRNSGQPAAASQQHANHNHNSNNRQQQQQAHTNHISQQMGSCSGGGHPSNNTRSANNKKSPSFNETMFQI